MLFPDSTELCSQYKLKQQFSWNAGIPVPGCVQLQLEDHNTNISGP
jgi:hypothetical protein